MIKLIPFKAEHIEQMNLRDYEKDSMANYGDAFKNFKQMEKPGLSFTLIHKEKIIGCAGVAMIWKGVGEGWMMVSPLIYKYPITVYKLTKKHLEEIIIKHNMHRIQIICHEFFSAAHRWAKHLGFERESLLKQYGVDKSNFIRYVRII